MRPGVALRAVNGVLDHALLFASSVRCAGEALPGCCRDDRLSRCSYSSRLDGTSDLRRPSARMWSFVNWQFDTTKQNPQRSSNDLRLFEPGKLPKSFQYLAVGLRKPDGGLLQIGRTLHDKDTEAIEIPNCMASVWRIAQIATKLD